jgi:hypothetical protein
MSAEIDIKGNGGGVGIAVFGYENIDATNTSDALASVRGASRNRPVSG